ncbi:MAG: Cysteine--tRNA ligase [Firmicutes bacterium ADurb.Bin506]|nr:MAG: Cysteine--tRNA ligase [Firmicutes bacterium ADurb.Bin506]
MIELGDVVGILSFESVEAARAGAGTGAGAGEGAEGDVGQCDAGDANQLAEALIELLLEIRADVRALKQYALSDKIRGRLAEVGIMVEDTKDGARWKRVSQ